jgi:hypothetical protein
VKTMYDTVRVRTSQELEECAKDMVALAKEALCARGVIAEVYLLLDGALQAETEPRLGWSRDRVRLALDLLHEYQTGERLR